jgi:cytochrome c peroxidase
LCHISIGKKPLFTDFTFDNLGSPINPENPVYDYNPSFIDYGLGGFLLTRTDYSSMATENMGKHKVPTLRNVDKRPDNGFTKAYMHNGVFKSLKEVVHFYNTRDDGSWPAPEVSANINTVQVGNLGLSDAEENAIVAFMKTLSDGYRIK